MKNQRVFLETYRYVLVLVVLNSLLFCFVCYFFWWSTLGFQNAIDSSPGLPEIIDLGLLVGIVLNLLASLFIVRWIIQIKPSNDLVFRKGKKKTKWDIMPGPPISKNYPKGSPKKVPKELKKKAKTVD
jgi:hypothetical protein